jgi:ribosomal protein L37AE/L43A
MRSSASNFNTRFIVCPLCEEGELQAFGRDSARCGSCGGLLAGQTIETLLEIVLLPDALGNRACECGHPEMGRLPDGVFHCPACGSEVLPIKSHVLLLESAASGGSTVAPTPSVGQVEGFEEGNESGLQIDRNREMRRN